MIPNPTSGLFASLDRSLALPTLLLLLLFLTALDKSMAADEEEVVEGAVCIEERMGVCQSSSKYRSAHVTVAVVQKEQRSVPTVKA